MNLSNPVVIVLGALVLVGLAVILWRSRDSRVELPAAPPSLPRDPDDEVLQLIAAGNKIGAIKRVRELTGMGLKEAKDYVEALPNAPGLVAARVAPTPTADPTGDPEVQQLLAAGNKIGAIKRVRELTGMGLKEAKDYVDALPDGANSPPFVAAPAIAGNLAADPEVQQLLAAGNKIGAIKRVRELSGWGLKEAKDYIDAL